MARYTGADCRRCRREKMKLFLKGSKCDGPKCPFESRPFPPGQHGRGRTKETEYLLQHREKQKAMTPFVVAQAQAGSRGVPAWLEPIPSEMKILIHSLPARAVIDTQVQEQLIVELYSK